MRSVRQRGWSERQVGGAVESGLLLRPRKGWVAVRDADPLLVAAARAGVVLSCITQARRLGLWILRGSDHPHVAAAPSAGGVRAGGATVHWARPVVPRHPDALVDSVENVLSLVAHCLPFEEALTVWESALDKRLVTLPGLRGCPAKRVTLRMTRSSCCSGIT